MNKQKPNLHSNFFSSLKQVEKRLKLETSSSPKPPQNDYNSTESLSSPLFLYPIYHNATHNSNLEFSETPNEFFSNSIDFPPSQQNPLPQTPQNLPESSNRFEDDDVDVDDIGLLIELLGLSDCDGDDPNSELKTCSSCRCGGGFYDKIVGVKGPKCDKEVERLEGWIRHFGKEGIEPLRMAHLLLGKAAFLSGGGGGETEGLEFPSTVEEFLQIDYPIAKED